MKTDKPPVKPTRAASGRAKARAPHKPEPPAVDKTRRLLVPVETGKTQDRAFTDLVAHGIATNASTAMRYVGSELENLSLTDMVASLREQGEAVNGGDLSSAERMLNAQAVALNAMFAELARRAALNMGTHLGATESYLRLALKAQSQSRATVETLAAIKNPRVVFARQANINNGGQQQVNNGPVPEGATARAHAEESKGARNELLEQQHGEWLDPRAQSTAGGADPHLAPLGEVNRAAHG